MKEKKISLIIGSHAHVPSGAPESEFEDIYVKKMRPFVSNLYRYSKIQAVLHYSGVFLYWVERTHPEIFMLIEDMVSRKQTEILSGGFFEPMFLLIPPNDRVGQIELLTTYLRRHFGKRPLGCWIPGMAWEQHLASSLSASYMNYTFLSHEQFLQAGMSRDELFYPCITEDQGKLITIFPVSSFLEKEIEKKSFSQVFIEKNRQIAEEYGFSKEKIISIFPEKIYSAPAESPDTAWNRFFEEVSLSENYVETVLPSKIIKNLKSCKKASFPNSTSLNNGFSPRNFLIEQCEINGIYSKMIFTNVLISQIKGDKSRKQNAREELWKAQDSSLFIPGNGQKSNDLRKAAYSSLLRAEQLSREKGKFIPSIIQYDFDFDGKMESLFQDMVINCYIQLKGAGVFELDYLPKNWNYLDCGAFSSFGEKNKERRVAFADSLLPAETKVKDIEKSNLKGARLCFNEEFEAIAQEKKGKSCFMLPAADSSQPFGNIEINKCYMLKKDTLTVSYSLRNTGKESLDFCFATEINLSFAGDGEEYARFYNTDNKEKDTSLQKITENINNIKILDVINETQILIRSEKDFSCCFAPIFSDGFYQASRMLAFFPITLESGKTWTNEFALKFSH
ncbi:MAG: DUF1926 domain-containing protein [Treponema sp.]|nr:DUF1926 domain-containing protein [Treponema sp.]